MIRVHVIPPTRILLDIETNITRSPALLKTAFRRQTGIVRAYAKTKLRRVPGKPHYPIRWTSERQRRAFFASNGFGRGIPTQRTNEMVNAWDVRFTLTNEGGELALTNDTDYWSFVVGDDQQGFHKDTGWYYYGDVIGEVQEFAVNSFTEIFFTVSDPFAGVPPT